MLSALRRSLQQTTQQSRRIQFTGAQSRKMSDSVIGTEWRAAKGTETVVVGTSTSVEFDADHAEFVSKEVSIHDRRPRLTAAQMLKKTEDDYDSPNSAPSCWGRTDESTGGMPPPFFASYEQPLEDPTDRKQQKKED